MGSVLKGMAQHVILAVSGRHDGTGLPVTMTNGWIFLGIIFLTMAGLRGLSIGPNAIFPSIVVSCIMAMMVFMTIAQRRYITTSLLFLVLIGIYAVAILASLLDIHMGFVVPLWEIIALILCYRRMLDKERR